MDFYDDDETRSDNLRDEKQFALLRAILTDAKNNAPAYAKLYEGIDIDAIQDKTDLSKLPVLRKSDLTEMQASQPPLGGLTTKPAAEFTSLYMSPGPIFEPGSDAPDWWRFARALYAAGLRKGDVILNCFAYHLTPAGAMFESGAKAIGATVIAGGVGNTDQQIEAIKHLRPRAYAGTPDFLKVILDRADDAGADVSSIQVALVSGGALFPSMRQEYADRGITCLQCYGTADLGLVAYESAHSGAVGAGMIIDEGAIVEILRPGTGDPVPIGEVGEVTVTTLNTEYPLIRFATGDLSAMMDGASDCGRTNARIKGWMGRADQTAKIKGMFVHPAQVDRVVKRYKELSKARLVVSRSGASDVFTLHCESTSQDATLCEQIKQSIRDELKLSGDVALCECGSLKNDGIVIEDTRDYND